MILRIMFRKVVVVVNEYMKLAIQEAFLGVKQRAGGPFGAVIVKDNAVIAKGYNQVIAMQDPTAHAEILAIREASKQLGRFDLSDCVLYTTFSPCTICSRLIVESGIKEVHYLKEYRDPLSKQILKLGNVKIVKEKTQK